MNTRKSGRNLTCVVTFCFAISLVCLGHAATFTLQWDPNTEQDLAGYKLYYGTASGDYSTTIDLPLADLNDPDNPERTVTDLDDGVTYWYRSLVLARSKI